jgi:hypothetical protein
VQELIIFLVFAAAVGYMGFRVYRSLFKKQTGCSKGCGCDTASKTTQFR